MRISPIFLAFVALAVLGGYLSWDDARTGVIPRLGVFLLVIGGWVVSLCLHEFAHAYVAYRSGDHSVEAAGYLTLNPLRYAHPFLSIVLPICEPKLPSWKRAVASVSAVRAERELFEVP